MKHKLILRLWMREKSWLCIDMKVQFCSSINIANIIINSIFNSITITITIIIVSYYRSTLRLTMRLRSTLRNNAPTGALYVTMRHTLFQMTLSSLLQCREHGHLSQWVLPILLVLHGFPFHKVIFFTRVTIFKRFTALFH